MICLGWLIVKRDSDPHKFLGNVSQKWAVFFSECVNSLTISGNICNPGVNQGMCILPENFRKYAHSLIWHIHCNIYTPFCICFGLLQLSSWPEAVRRRMTFTLYPVQLPDGPKTEIWRGLFKLCAAQRIFIPVSWTLFVVRLTFLPRDASTECGDVTVSRLSVRLSVHLSVRDV